MLLLAFALVAAALVAYTQIPALLIYWTYPWPVYGLLLASVAVAFRSPRRGWRRAATLAFSTAVALLFIVYTLVLSRLGPPNLAVRAGDRFPDFTLRTSTNDTFSPASLYGKSAALYVFYRGDW